MKNTLKRYYQASIRFLNSYLYKPKGIYTTSFDFVKSENKNGSIKWVHAESEIIRTNPISLINEPHPLFKIPAKGLAQFSPATFVVELKNARVVGQNGTIISNNNYLIEDISHEIGVKPNQHSILKKKQFSNLKKLNGKTLLVAANGASTNYFHWMFDCLPKFEILNQAKFELENFETILISGVPMSFQSETIRILNLPVTKIKWLNKDTHFRVEYLVVPSLPGLSGNIPHWANIYLKNLFKPYQVKDDSYPKKIWIDRSDSLNYRVIDRIDPVKNIFLKDFTCLKLGNLTLFEQIKYFYNADVISGTHGAGFTNLLFCKPGSKVIEILSNDYINQCYWTLASHSDLEYFYLIIANKDIIENSEDDNPLIFSFKKIL